MAREIMCDNFEISLVVYMYMPNITTNHAITYTKISRGILSDPARKLVAFGHSGLLPQMINPR